jgi:hypothetical protein
VTHKLSRPAYHWAISCFAGTTWLAVSTLFSCGRKSEMAVANARIFDIVLRIIGMGASGYAKPNNAQTANIKNMPAKSNSVYLDSFMAGDNASIAKYEKER